MAQQGKAQLTDTHMALQGCDTTHRPTQGTARKKDN